MPFLPRILFWLALLFTLYVYVGYPLLLWCWSRLATRPVRRRAFEPHVSVVIAARGEGLAAKLLDCLALDYPADKLEVVVALDGVDERSGGLARELARVPTCGRIRILPCREWRGKAAALNRAVAASRGEVVVFCDVRQRLDRSALRELVADLGDDEVGAVTGDLCLLGADGLPAAGGVGAYWRYEKAIRRMESAVHSTVGATGALYAVRRSLVPELPAGTILDDVLVPMHVVLAGKRTVHEPRARVYDHAFPLEQELARKVRTLAGNFQLLAAMPELLDPARNPIHLQLVSHKVGRLFVPYALLVLLLSSLLLREGISLALLVAQCAFYALALAVGALRTLRRTQTGGTSRGAAILGIPYAFVLMNAAAVLALHAHLTGAGAESLWRGAGGEATPTPASVLEPERVTS